MLITIYKKRKEKKSIKQDTIRTNMCVLSLQGVHSDWFGLARSPKLIRIGVCARMVWCRSKQAKGLVTRPKRLGKENEGEVLETHSCSLIPKTLLPKAISNHSSTVPEFTFSGGKASIDLKSSSKQTTSSPFSSLVDRFCVYCV